MTELHLSGDEQADRLVSDDALALLIGMVLDQQVTIEQAFRGPAELVARLGLAKPLDARRIASMDPDALAEAFSRRPSVHRYPSSMAARVQELCRVVADQYGGDAAGVWTDARDGLDLRRRVEALPGFGERKARIFVALCGKRLGVRPRGWREASEPFGEPGSFLSVADIVDMESLAEVRRQKREAKAAAKAAVPTPTKGSKTSKPSKPPGASKTSKAVARGTASRTPPVAGAAAGRGRRTGRGT